MANRQNTSNRFLTQALILLVPVLLGGVIYVVGNESARIEIVNTLEAMPRVLERDATLIFTGDVMLDRGVRLHAQAFGDESLFKEIAATLSQADAVVINLETTVTNEEPVAVPNGEVLRFTSDPHFLSLLSGLQVRVATLSNNHTDDFGEFGLEETKDHLTASGIAYYGSPSSTPLSLSTTITVNGKKVCFVGYEGFIATDAGPLAAEIARLRPHCDYLAATMHAGEEYQHEPTWLQVEAAHTFIDAGADAVFGTHPHIVEPLELYKGKPIFYSLGNFMFDQNFSWETTHGLLVKVTIGSQAVRYDLIPTNIIHAEASLSNEEDGRRTLEALITDSLPQEYKESILNNRSFSIR